MKIDHLVLGLIETNTYIPVNPETGECVIIDPADNAKRIINYLDGQKLKPVAILLTHGHFDHIMAVKDLQTEYGMPVYAHEKEEEILAEPSAGLLRIDLKDKAILSFNKLHDSDVIELIGFKWKVLHTPGHTRGSVCYYIEDAKIIFSGDTVFKGTYGRTDLATGNFEEIKRSITEKIFAIPCGDVNIFPGHGESTTLEYEKQHNHILMDS